MSNLHVVRRTIFFVLFIFLVSCGRNGGSGSRGRGTEGPAAADAPVAAEPVAAAGPVAYDVYFDNSASMDGYLAGPGTDLKTFASALGFGILLDATIVRSLLVPALVSMFGQWNWWLPDGLAKLLRVPPSAATPAPALSD